MDGRLVPDENVGEGGANKICDQTENPLQDSMLASISKKSREKEIATYQTIKKKLRN